MTEAPVSFELPIEGATTNYKQNEVGMTVLFAPHISERDQREMGARNYRRVIQRTGRKVGIRGMMYDDFMKKDITDQFLFLRQYIPDGSSPVDIGPWYEDVKAVETPVGKFNWPAPPEGVVYKLDKDGNKHVIPQEEYQYRLDESGNKVNPVVTAFSANDLTPIPPAMAEQRTCKVCGGTGERLAQRCPECLGTGRVRV